MSEEYLTNMGFVGLLYGGICQYIVCPCGKRFNLTTLGVDRI